MNRITVVTLGNSPDGLTHGTVRAMKEADRLILRTAQTPVSSWLTEQGISFESLDGLYEAADDFDLLNQALTDAVMKAAEQGPVVYAVLDAQWDESVRILSEKIPESVIILPGTGLFDGLRLLHPRARICAADDLPDILGDEELLLVEIDSALLAGEIKLRMIGWFGADCLCTWYPPENAKGRRSAVITLQNLDRQRRYDHTAALYIAPQPLKAKERYTVQDLVRIMRILRSPEGCPWDWEQTHESLRPYLIEEAYEVTQAIREEDWLHVADELGDVLLQVIFQSNIGEQYGTLELSDITTAICRKMIRRHPHIFSDVEADSPDAVSRNWDAIKRDERGQKSLGDVLNDIPDSLPPLMRAQKALKKAAGAGAWTDEPEDALDSITTAAKAVCEDASAADRQHDLGELLFRCADLARLNGVDSEVALADAVDAFVKRLCGEH